MGIIISIALAAFLATFLGGMFALRFRDKLHLIIGFSAGAVIGVAFFDLLPEALDLTNKFFDASFVACFIAFGFVLYLLIDRFFSLHSHGHHDHHHDHAHEHKNRGVFRASSLSLHSFLDGVGIGLSFHVSVAVGLVVAIAVLAHDFSDGINTVSAIIKGGQTKERAMRWLLVDALAPVAGIVLTQFFVIGDGALGLLLALFSGFFLYIGASDLNPESFHAHPTKWTTFATVFGIVFIFVVIQLAN